MDLLLIVEPPLAETLAVFAAVFAATYALPATVDAAEAEDAADAAVSYALLTAEAEAASVVLVHAVDVNTLPVVRIVLYPAPIASADACQTALV